MAPPGGDLREFMPDDLESSAGNPREGLVHIVARSPSLPLLQLDNRHFETLAFLILRERAGTSTYYNDVSLLPVGADSGRDILLRRGAVTGVVQCKRRASRLGRKEILREVLRLALYAIRDPSLRPAPGTRYELWTASGITGGARELLDAADFASVARAEMPDLVAGARAGIASLRPHGDEARDGFEEAQALEIAATLVLKHVGPEAIADDLARLPEIRRQFFRSPDDGPPMATNGEVDALVATLRQEQMDTRRRAGRLGGDRYVPHGSLATAFAEFIDDPSRSFVVVGGSGQGKTSWAARLLSSPPSGWSTVMIPAEQIVRSDRNPVDTVGRLLTARPLGGTPPERIDQAVWNWLDAGNRNLVVDGLDRTLSDAREGLLGWIDAAVATTGRVPLKLVLTTRREAWSGIVAASSELGPAIFHPEDGGPPAASVELQALTPDEAEVIYRAYGVSAEQHRGARLGTPSLIALFSRMRDRAGTIVTRLDILTDELALIERELRAVGIGQIATTRTLAWIGNSLLASTDGWISVGDDASVNEALEAMIRLDRLVQRDGRVRMDADDLAELLLARRLTAAGLIPHLDRRRRDAIFMGAASLVIAALESRDGMDEALGVLLDDAPPGMSSRLDAACLAILEVREPLLIRSRIEQAVRLWNRDNFMLVASGLGKLLTDLDVPGADLFDLVMPLSHGENADDWRDKHWEGSQPGRWMSSFAVAAERAVATAPEALVPSLVALAHDQDQLRSSIGRTLLYRAARAAPQAVLDGTWTALGQSTDAFRVAQSAAPSEAASFLADVTLGSGSWTRFVIDRLWVIAERLLGDEPDRTRLAAVRDAADRLLDRIEDPSLRAPLLILRLRVEQQPRIRRELERLWPLVEGERYWHALAAIGGEAALRLANLLAGGEPDRDIGAILRAMPLGHLDRLDPAPLLEPLRDLLRRSPELAQAVAGSVEAMLYGHPAPALPKLEAFAIELAASPDDYVRAQLTYYAGSIVHDGPTPAEIARRERILGELVEQETGENLGILVWKIMESTPERPGPQRHLDELARRHGAEKVREIMDIHSFLPAAADLDRSFGLD